MKASTFKVPSRFVMLDAANIAAPQLPAAVRQQRQCAFNAHQSLSKQLDNVYMP
jgi:hypothetical protein